MSCLPDLPEMSFSRKEGVHDLTSGESPFDTRLTASLIDMSVLKYIRWIEYVFRPDVGAYGADCWCVWY